ncbi:MAG: hypothetical protein OXI91_01865 [Chloroflexota bacterium]|nr:hypothetical protein [Chloroflexota bacterium]
MTTGSHEERISRLEGAFEMFATVVNNMVTREEHQASIGALRQEMRAEIQAAELRLTRWIVGSAFSTATLVIAVIKLWP